ncbi:MAG: hypothetical protein R2724_26375 [Bryobacterales bacterium]
MSIPAFEAGRFNGDVGRGLLGQHATVLLDQTLGVFLARAQHARDVGDEVFAGEGSAET